MLAQQLEGLGGLGEDADGFGAAYVDGVVIALPGEDVGDPVDGGFEPDGITGGGAGDDHFQPVFARPTEPHKPFLGSEGCLLFGAERVGFDDRGLEQGVQPAQDSFPTDGASWASTQPACAAVRCRVAAAMWRAWWAGTCPVSAAAQIERSRCRRSSASAISRDAEPSDMRNAQPSSAGQNPATVGVPSPPSCTGRSLPDSRLSGTASPGWMSAQ